MNKTRRYRFYIIPTGEFSPEWVMCELHAGETLIPDDQILVPGRDRAVSGCLLCVGLAVRQCQARELVA